MKYSPLKKVAVEAPWKSDALWHKVLLTTYESTLTNAMPTLLSHNHINAIRRLIIRLLQAFFHSLVIV